MNNLDYGIIGNCNSAALISKHGAIDWCCLPNFDASSVFAKILDERIGGSFEILVDKKYTISQKYIHNTNILVTEFREGLNVFEAIDFMPRYREDSGGFYAPPEIIRYIKHISGAPKFSVRYDPKLEYAKSPTTTVKHDSFIKSTTNEDKYDTLYLYTDVDFDMVLEGQEITLTEHAYFVISYHEKILAQNLERIYLKMQRTRVYWLNWSEKTTHFKVFAKEIMRSALVLKLLSYEKSGAVLAAATTSLPEAVGEERNWDYRFCWIRDASMVIKVISGIGHTHMAQRFLDFIIRIIPDKDEKIQIMYGINGEKELTEYTLDHLSGYQNSGPVRVGNAAYKQKQNDIYGILMDVIYQQFVKFDCNLVNSEELWTISKSIVHIVHVNWQRPDKGIWELRTEEKHFTFSKLLCWVAVDRAVKIGRLINKKNNLSRWETLRDTIYDDIYKNAWNEKVNAYTQSYGSDDLDASTLLMEAYGFIQATDPRFISTVQATEIELCHDGLMYRYKNKDDFGLPSSSFTICTFWLINSLFKIGQKKKALKLFKQLLTYSNHLGLFSEDIHFKSKRLLGNFPQAYSHLALIETAANFAGGLTEEDEIIAAMHHHED